MSSTTGTRADGGKLQRVAPSQFHRVLLIRSDFGNPVEKLQPSEAGRLQDLGAGLIGAGIAGPDAHGRPHGKDIRLLLGACDKARCGRTAVDGAWQMLVARRLAVTLAVQPDLEQVNGRRRGGVAFGVPDATARADQLDVARLEHAQVAFGVGVLQGAFEDEAQDLEVVMGVFWKARAAGDDVLVDDPQRPESHAGRIIE